MSNNNQMDSNDNPQQWLNENGLNDLVISHPYAGDQYIQYVSDALRSYGKDLQSRITELETKLTLRDENIDALVKRHEEVLDENKELRVATQQWVEIKSAKDFPKNYGHVMVYGRFTKDCPMNVYQALFNPKGGKFYSDGILSKGVTHWMPRPDPPEIAEQALKPKP